MSQEHDLDRTVTVTRGDVTVEKSFEAEEFPVPAVAFHIQSSDSEPIEVRLVDQIPEEFPMSAIGFHPDFESDCWSAYKDHRVVFERTLEPGEDLRTVYGVRLDREEDAAAFLNEPTLEGVGNADEHVEDILGDDRNQAVRDVLAGDRDSLVEADEPDSAVDAAGPDDGQESAVLELEDPTAEERDDSAASDEGFSEADDSSDADESTETDDSSGADGDAPSPRSAPAGTAAITELDSEGVGTEPHRGADVADEAESGEGATGVGARDGVAEALAAEIRDGDVDDEDLRLLRQELDLGVPRSVDVRIRRLQRTVSDLDAYADALEEFIDEEGTAQELIQSFRGDVESLSQTVDDLESNVVEAEQRLDALDDDVEDVRSDLSDVDAALETATGEIDTVSDEVDRVSEEVEQVTTEVDGLATDVETLREDLGEEIDGVERQLHERTDDLEATMEDEIDAVRTEVDRTVDDVLAEAETNADKLDELEADFREFEQFRERLEQAFGGMGGVDDADEADDADEEN